MSDRSARPRYLLREEAAEYLRLSPRTLAMMAARGEGPTYARAGKRALYDPADLDAWVARHRRVMPSASPTEV